MTSNIIASELGTIVYESAGWDPLDLCEIVYTNNKIHIYNLDLELRKRETAREQINR
jgi:hypothetical protein